LPLPGEVQDNRKNDPTHKQPNQESIVNPIPLHCPCPIDGFVSCLQDVRSVRDFPAGQTKKVMPGSRLVFLSRFAQVPTSQRPLKLGKLASGKRCPCSTRSRDVCQLRKHRAESTLGLDAESNFIVSRSCRVSTTASGNVLPITGIISPVRLSRRQSSPKPLAKHEPFRRGITQSKGGTYPT
jgi:hypothetical protein